MYFIWMREALKKGLGRHASSRKFLESKRQKLSGILQKTDLQPDKIPDIFFLLRSKKIPG